jgi:hypothetical protein
MSDSSVEYGPWFQDFAEGQLPNHYVLLGIEPLETDPKKIVRAADERIRQLKSVQAETGSEQSNQIRSLIRLIEKVKVSLLNPRTKLPYDTALGQSPVASTQTPSFAWWQDWLPFLTVVAVFIIWFCVIVSSTFGGRAVTTDIVRSVISICVFTFLDSFARAAAAACAKDSTLMSGSLAGRIEEYFSNAKSRFVVKCSFVAWTVLIITLWCARALGWPLLPFGILGAVIYLASWVPLHYKTPQETRLDTPYYRMRGRPTALFAALAFSMAAVYAGHHANVGLATSGIVLFGVPINLSTISSANQNLYAVGIFVLECSPAIICTWLAAFFLTQWLPLPKPQGQPAKLRFVVIAPAIWLVAGAAGNPGAMRDAQSTILGTLFMVLWLTVEAMIRLRESSKLLKQSSDRKLTDLIYDYEEFVDHQISEARQTVLQDLTQQCHQLFDRVCNVPVDQLSKNVDGIRQPCAKNTGPHSDGSNVWIANARKKIVLAYTSHLETFKKHFAEERLDAIFEWVLNPEFDEAQISEAADLCCKALDKVALRAKVQDAYDSAESAIKSYYPQVEFAADLARLDLSVPWHRYQDLAREIEEYIQALFKKVSA